MEQNHNAPDASPPEEEPFTVVSRKKKSNRTVLPTVPVQLQPTLPTKQSITTLSEGQILPGWGSRSSTTKKVKKNSQRAKMMGSQAQDSNKGTLEWGQLMIDERRSILENSSYYKAVEKLVQSLLMPTCDSSSPTEIVKHRKEGLAVEAFKLENTKQESEKPGSAVFDPNPVVDIICYGIGSVEDSRSSQFQLALILVLKDLLQISGTISIFDPVMTDFDKDLAQDLGICILDNTASKQQITARTLLYMPHCPKGLYSLVLESNWTRSSLNKMIILGNRFSMYDESVDAKLLNLYAPFILPAVAIVSETELPRIGFDTNTIFNDLAIHLFPPHFEIPEVDTTNSLPDPELSGS